MVTVTHPTDYNPERLLGAAKDMEKAIEQAKLPESSDLIRK